MKICKESEVKEEGAVAMKELEAENEQIGVWRIKGELRAMDSRCPHMGGPLHKVMNNHTRSVSFQKFLGEELGRNWWWNIDIRGVESHLVQILPLFLPSF